MNWQSKRHLHTLERVQLKQRHLIKLENPAITHLAGDQETYPHNPINHQSDSCMPQFYFLCNQKRLKNLFLSLKKTPFFMFFAFPTPAQTGIMATLLRRAPVQI